MPLQRQIFHDITRAKFNAIKCKAASLVDIKDDAGRCEKDGFTIQWNYFETGRTLVIQCIDKPWLVPESMVTSKIKELVDNA